MENDYELAMLDHANNRYYVSKEKLYLKEKFIGKKDLLKKYDVFLNIRVSLFNEITETYKNTWSDKEKMSKKNKLILTEEFEKIWVKIENGENFAFLRYGDGERAIMEGRSVKAQEGWKSPEHLTKLGEDCLKTLELQGDSVWYGISCPCCDRAAYYWYASRIKSSNITFANLWVNINYQRFKESISNLERDVVVIANHNANNKKFGKMNVLKYYLVSDDCIKFWEESSEKFIASIINDMGEKNDLLYVISAGPMSEPIIAKLYENNPNNCYIDFGSAVDSFIYDKVTRPYMNSRSSYAKQNCEMPRPESLNMYISVICTLYKRPECLIQQIDALNRQTLKPREILLFQDGIDEEYSIELKQSLKARFSNVYICHENVGVWGRFKYALDASNDYVCIFDDDTIPGRRWLENCFCSIMERDGIYGTIGIMFNDRINNYPFGGYYRVGWASPYSKQVEVDFVGHSWFLKKRYLEYMFKDTEDIQKYKYAAEDMCLSMQCQKMGISTFVPAHPYDNRELWGSQPTQGRIFGETLGALSMTNANHIRMKNAVNELNEKGWQHIYDRNPKYVVKIYRRIKKEKCIYYVKKIGKKIIYFLRK